MRCGIIILRKACKALLTVPVVTVCVRMVLSDFDSHQEKAENPSMVLVMFEPPGRVFLLLPVRPCGSAHQNLGIIYPQKFVARAFPCFLLLPHNHGAEIFIGRPVNKPTTRNNGNWISRIIKADGSAKEWLYMPKAARTIGACCIAGLNNDAFSKRTGATGKEHVEPRYVIHLNNRRRPVQSLC